MAIMVFMLALSGQALMKPFTNVYMNRFETISLFVSAATFLLGIFTLNSEMVSNTTGVERASSWALGLNIFYFVLAMFYGWKIYQAGKKRKAVRKAVKALNQANLAAAQAPEVKSTSEDEKTEGVNSSTHIVSTTENTPPQSSTQIELVTMSKSESSANASKQAHPEKENTASLE